MLKEIKDILGRASLIIEALMYLHHVLFDLSRHFPFDFVYVLIVEQSLVDQDIALALARASDQLLLSTGKQLQFLYIRKGADDAEVTGSTVEAMLMTDEAYQTKGWRAATYLITNEIKAFKFRDGAPLPREWGKGRLVSYKLSNDFSTRLSDSFLGLSKRPAHLQDIFTYLAEKLHEEKAVIMTYIFRESYGWAQLRCGISIKFDLDHLSPDLNIIFRNKHKGMSSPESSCSTKPGKMKGAKLNHWQHE